ncbi:MAG: hypothetical protein LBT21_00295 [Oscillospiraceae bacterium]|jgi:hypothetical protein|nr:hypothetical protein [Oscillospiraceae bacterium]
MNFSFIQEIVDQIVAWLQDNVKVDGFDLTGIIKALADLIVGIVEKEVGPELDKLG